MKNNTKIIIYFLLFITNIVTSQWTQTGPYGGFVRCIAANDSILLAGTDRGGIYKSSTKGKSWSLNNTGILYSDIYSLFMDAQNIIVGTNAKVYRSTNNGNNWLEINFGTSTTNKKAYDICKIDGTILINTFDNIYFSTNNCQDWKSLYPNLPNKYIYTLTAYNSNIYIGTSNGVYKSTDYGESWTSLGLLGKYVRCLSFYDSNIFAGVYGQGIYVSHDNGKKWNVANTGLPPVYNDPNKPWARSFYLKKDTVFVATVSGVFVSIDSAKTWRGKNDGLPVSTSVYAFVKMEKSIFIATNYGVYVTQNNGNKWHASYRGISRSAVYSLVSNNSDIFAGTDLGLFISTDEGNNWNDYGLEGKTITSIVVNDSDIYAGTSAGFGGIFHSSNNGIIWNTINTGLPTDETSVYTLGKKDKSVYAGLFNQGIFRSTDKGATWTPSGLNGTKYTEGEDVLSLAFLGTNIIVGTFSRGLFVSPNDGESWLNVVAPETLSGITVMSLLTIDSNIYAGTHNGVFVSTNGGLSWSGGNVGLPIIAHVYSVAVSGKHLFAGLIGRGLFHSSDTGRTWQDISYNLPSNCTVYSLLLDGANIYAGTWPDGVWRMSISSIITNIENSDNKNIPTHFILEQNYPNPFNPTTKIKYSVPKQSFVTIKIYDSLGREVITLLNEEKLIGNYTIEYNAANLSSGIYFYQIKSDEFLETKKMILLR